MPDTSRLRAADGVEIAVRHDPSAGPDADPGLAIVVGHGFTGSLERPELRAVADRFTRYAGVVSLDFRGHGRSGGETTVGGAEVLDLAAAVAWARALGYPRLATVGFSMGAAVVVRHAALAADPPDAAVAVSGPSRWHYHGTRPMRVLHRACGTRAGRAFLRRTRGTRVSPADFDPAFEPPDAVAGRIAPVPLLVVHGDRDHYFPLDHARWLARAAGPTATLWEIPGMGHAEAAMSPGLTDQVAHWLRTATHPARVPLPAEGGRRGDARGPAAG